MLVFLDFEASSLSDDGYPIEVGWIFEDGRSESYLIKPAPQWTDWDAEAEALHGISRAMLEAEGTDHSVVAHRLLDQLSGSTVYASAPSWDGKWLSVLFRASGIPRHALRLKDSDELHLEAAIEGLQGPSNGESTAEEAEALVAEAQKTFNGAPVTHRALEDAKLERQIWLEVRRLARERALSAAERKPSER
jgi:DNA polymerase III epsilon subunit-like protein